MSVSTLERAEFFYRQAIDSIRSKRYGDAEQKLKKAIKANPRHSASYAAMGDVGMESGRAVLALKNYSHALKLNPQNAKVWRNMGSVQLLMIQDYNAAVESLTQAIQLDPSDPQTYYFLARASYNMRNYADAAALLEAGLQIAPLHEQMIATLGMSYLVLRHFEKAKEYLYRAFQMNPREYHIFSNILQASRSLDFDPEQITEINKIADELKDNNKFKDKVAIHFAYHYRKTGDLDALEKTLCTIETGDPEVFTTKNYLLGDLYNQQGRYDDAFEAYNHANRVQAKSANAMTLQLNSVYALFQETYDYLRKDNAQAFSDCIKKTPKAPYQTPYFIIGFPRSGTTLTGQILNQHEKLITLDEYSALDQLKLYTNQKYKIALPRDFDSLRDYHFTYMHTLYDERQANTLSENPDHHIVDKMPFNTAHIASALQLFPDTKFIYVQRHPLDCVLSCFMQNFGLNAANIHFLDITRAAKLYKANHELWTYYKNTLNFDYQEVRYEDIVTNFDQEIGKAIACLNLDWRDNLRHFHETQAIESGPSSLTPSRNQVNQELYTDAIYRWKHYRAHLEPAIEILEPIIKELGYEL